MPQPDEFTYEQIEAFNERYGITFNGLSGGVGGPHVQLGYYFVSGEVFARDGAAIKGPFRIMAAALDDSGRIVGAGSHDIGRNGFFGVLAFEIFLGTPPKESRVVSFRVFPQPPAPWQ